jgi:cell wall-associated protease
MNREVLSFLRFFLTGWLALSSTLVLAIEVPAAARNPTTDPYSRFQWGLLNQGQVLLDEADDLHTRRVIGIPGSDIGAPTHDLQLDRTVVVAVLDSGIDVDHPDLAGAIATNDAECENGRVPGKPQIDRDGNGFIGDCMGWSFVSKSADGEARVTDEIGHGTHVAGVIAARANNAIGVAGLSNQIRILPLKVYGRQEKSALSLAERLVRAVRYATARKVDVINLSMGWPKATDTPELRRAFREALDGGITIVAAAGNNSTSDAAFPCAYSGVICVGAITVNGEIASFSNFGSQVDLLAPGDQVLSLFPERLTPVHFQIQGYEVKSGSSQAAPFVSAIAAVLKGRLPELTETELRSRLFATARPDRTGRALFGTVRMAAAVESRLAATLVPDFKEGDGLRMLSRDGQSAEGVMKLRVSSEGLPSTNVRIRIEPLTPGYRVLNAETHFEEIEQGASAGASVTITADSLDVEQIFEYRVILSSGQSPLSTFVSRQRARITPFHRLLPFVSEKIAPGELRSVDIRHSERDTTEYFHWKRGQDFRLLRITQAGVEETARISAPEWDDLLAFRRLDLDGDGQEDYWICAVARDPAQPTQKFLKLLWLDSTLKPLSGPPSSMDWRPSEAVPDFKRLAWTWIPHSASRSGRIRTPVFESEGKLPESEQPKNRFDPRDETTRRRTYVLQFPKPSLRTFDSPEFEKSFRERQRLPFRDSIRPVAMIPQGPSDLQSGRIRLLVSIGRVGSETQGIATWSSADPAGQWTWMPLSIEVPNLRGWSLLRPWGDSPDSLVAAAIHSGRVAQHWRLGSVSAPDLGTSTRVDSADSGQAARDSLLGVMASFETSAGSTVVYQTKTQLLSSFRGKDGRERIFSRGISRFSFLPGQLMSDVYHPMTVSIEGRNTAAFYVDSSAILGDHVTLLIQYLSGEWRAPLRWSLDIPSGCRALNPGSRQLTFHCAEGLRQISL